MKTVSIPLQKFLYGLTFLVLVPATLICWAKAADSHVGYPALKSEKLGIFLLLAGGLLMAWAMRSLITEGKGLPMNAFPPKKFVATGAYLLFRHPIYWGFGSMLTGYFLWVGPASGLWLVTPVTLLGMAALVLGFEGSDLKKRFPDQQLGPLFELPASDRQMPGAAKRVACLGSVLLLMATLNYLAAQVLGGSLLEELKALFSVGRGQNAWLYLNLAPLLVAPFVLKHNADLRSWALWTATALGSGFLLSLLVWEFYRASWLSPAGDSLFVPAYALLIAGYAVFRNARYPYVGAVLTALPFLAIQALMLEAFPLHLLGSVVLFLGVVHGGSLWGTIRRLTENLANSWREWVFGRIRVINHGFYVGAGAFLGILYAGILAGAAYAWALLAFTAMVVLFSAVWAQVIEGSEKLKRPFGFYGALVGIVFASLLVWALGFDPWVLIGVISVMMPWVQAIGRMRCLINGCCHGSITTDPKRGIRYFHPRSRVCHLSEMKGELLHPTPLYSILWLVPVGFVLLALWHSGSAPNFIFGLYLVLTGIGRFVEEAYRGEVQTPVLGKLRLYQWTALLSVMIGIVFTLFRVEMPALHPGFQWQVLWSALAGGLFLLFAMGVDFPQSNRRFSRLV